MRWVVLLFFVSSAQAGTLYDVTLSGGPFINTGGPLNALFIFPDTSGALNDGRVEITVSGDFDEPGEFLRISTIALPSQSFFELSGLNISSTAIITIPQPFWTRLVNRGDYRLLLRARSTVDFFTVHSARVTYLRVPEPSTWLLVLTGLLYICRRRM